MPKHYTIIVEGAIGVGKTSFINYLGKYYEKQGYKVYTYTEPVEIDGDKPCWRRVLATDCDGMVTGEVLNPLIINNEEGGRYSAQHVFLGTSGLRYDALRRDAEKAIADGYDVVSILERSIEACRVFIKIGGFPMTPMEQTAWRITFDAFKTILTPYLGDNVVTILLCAPTDTLVHRVHVRGREEEVDGLSIGYMDQVNTDMIEAFPNAIQLNVERDYSEFVDRDAFYKDATDKLAEHFDMMPSVDHGSLGDMF